MAKKMTLWVPMATFEFEKKQHEQAIAEKEVSIQTLTNDLKKVREMLHIAKSDLEKINLKHRRLLKTLEVLIRSEHETNE